MYYGLVSCRFDAVSYRLTLKTFEWSRLFAIPTLLIYPKTLWSLILDISLRAFELNDS